jgi:hypothetical protein
MRMTPSISMTHHVAETGAPKLGAAVGRGQAMGSEMQDEQRFIRPSDASVDAAQGFPITFRG